MLGRLPPTFGSGKILGPALGPAGEVPRAVRSQIAYLPQSLALQGRSHPRERSSCPSAGCGAFLVNRAAGQR